jgi:hypothetical protein
MADVPKGRFTFRFAAVCFGLSAVWELLDLSGEVFLAGRFVGGTGAAVYHVVYAALFAWLMIGLWAGRRSGYYTLMVTTVFVTVDRLQVLFIGNALEKIIRQQMAGNEDLLAAVSMGDLIQVLTLTTVVIVLCWWGFAGYAYFRCEYFGIHRKPRAS